MHADYGSSRYLDSLGGHNTQCLKLLQVCLLLVLNVSVSSVRILTGF
jgi:hypothetical protein